MTGRRSSPASATPVSVMYIGTPRRLMKSTASTSPSAYLRQAQAYFLARESMHPSILLVCKGYGGQKHIRAASHARRAGNEPCSLGGGLLLTARTACRS